MFRYPILKAAAAVLAFGGAVLTWTGADAGERTGTWRNGMVDGPFGPGYYNPYGYYGGGYRRPWGYHGYYGASVYAPECYTVHRRFVDDWGRVFIRRTRVCE